MKKKGKLSGWLWLIIPAVIFFCIGAYFFLQLRKESGNEPLSEPALYKDEDGRVVEGLENLYPEGVSSGGGPQRPGDTTEPPGDEPLSGPDTEVQAGKDLNEYFRFLDQKEYVLKLDPTPDTRNRFRKILQLLSSNPPISVNETNTSQDLLKNISYFFRMLDAQDMKMIQSIIENERQTLEADMRLLYQCLVVDPNCPDMNDLRPSDVVVYQFAGFFINTIGGRAYLFRREPKLRLLISYFSTLIIHEADKAGKNTYGIDILPFTRQLKDEMSRYGDLQYQLEYLSHLNQVEDYYKQERKIE
jgi:hypothetical protein